MKKIILFFGSFDPIHKGHISIIENAIKKIGADNVYLGLNKCSFKGKLSPLFHRKKMLSLYCKNNNKCKLLNFSFDYKNLDVTYKNIFNLIENENKYYILLGEDQLANLNKWYKFDLLYKNFDFIIAKRDIKETKNEFINDPKFIFIDHDYKTFSSTNIKKGKYHQTKEIITDYILSHNIYLKEQIKPYLSQDRYNHTISVCETALLINEKANLGLDKYKVEKAALLHDIAKELDKTETRNIMNNYYRQYINENNNILHQYVSEHIARECFYVCDEEILSAIKYHTTGRANMSLLEKLIYVSDKIEPSRDYDTTKLINDCINNFEKGFINVLKNNKNYLNMNNIKITNKDNLECFKYYL